MLFNRKSGVSGWERFRPLARRQSAHDVEATTAFLSTNTSDIERYTGLFRYFLRGFTENLDFAGSRVNYPGMGSIRGFPVAGLEGFARTAPLLAAWICSGRDHVVDGVDLVDLVRKGILAGTDPRSAGYWGDMTGDDQRMVEASDIARVVWLTRKTIWEQFSETEKHQVVTWLLQVNTSVIRVRNNWILFPVVVNAALKAVGHPITVDYTNYWEFKEKHYRENGWFFDIPEGIDYYNCWGISYDLYWLHVFEPTLDAPFLIEALRQCAELTAHLISPKGVPIMGRSVCYRTAVASPVIAAARLPETGASAGLARHALDTTWRYFISHGALRQGTLTMGYFESDPRLVDTYTGPGSSHWGLRSLALALLSADQEAFWQAPAEKLPVEIGSYRLDLHKLGWVVEGEAGTQEITITIPANPNERIAIEPVSQAMRRQEFFTHQPVRPGNHAVKYKRRRYSALYPFTSE